MFYTLSARTHFQHDTGRFCFTFSKRLSLCTRVVYDDVTITQRQKNFLFFFFYLIENGNRTGSKANAPRERYIYYILAYPRLFFSSRQPSDARYVRIRKFTTYNILVLYRCAKYFTKTQRDTAVIATRHHEHVYSDNNIMVITTTMVNTVNFIRFLIHYRLYNMVPLDMRTHITSTTCTV